MVAERYGLALASGSFLKKIQKRYGYQQVMTPHIGGKNLYVTSGHYAHYGKILSNRFIRRRPTEEYMLKPMTVRIIVRFMLGAAFI